jgi:elongation factor P
MGIKVVDVRKGMVVIWNNALHLVVEFEHHTPGNLRAVNQLKMRNLRTGGVVQQRMGSGDILEVAYLDHRKCQYLYKDQGTGQYVFMDLESFDQHELPPELVESQMVYVKENQEVVVSFHEGRALGVELPSTVILEIREAEGAARGNTVNNTFKNAVTETGLSIRVPSFIEAGEFVKVNTETGEFQGRAKA